MAPEHYSIAISAKPLSEPSVREQGDQITEGRFEPATVDTGIGTGQELIDQYVYKQKTDMGTITSPIIIGEKKPNMVSTFI